MPILNSSGAIVQIPNFGGFTGLYGKLGIDQI